LQLSGRLTYSLRMASYLILRLALASEAAALEALQWRASLAREEYREQLLANPDAILLPIDQIEAGQVIVAEDGGTILGFAAWRPAEARAIELDGLFVEPEHWGEGIGSRLVEAIVSAALEQRAPTLNVIAAPHALPFYTRCGFVRTGDAPTRFGPAVAMARRLRGP
jgi:GNAT superfamily N-acetyltransferase